jgi:hypothetical protein
MAVNVLNKAESFTIRVESHDQTLVSKRTVTVDSNDLDLSAYGITDTFTEAKPVHVLIAGLKAKGLDPTKEDVFKWTQSDFGPFLDTVAGVSFTSVSDNDGWTYTVNNVSAPLGFTAYDIENGDDVVFAFNPHYYKSSFSYFETENKTANAGQAFEVKLLTTKYVEVDGNWITQDVPVEGARILLNNQPLLINGKEVLTNAQGKATVTLTQTWYFDLSADKIVDGVNTISRPYMKVTVLNKPSSGNSSSSNSSGGSGGSGSSGGGSSTPSTPSKPATVENKVDSLNSKSDALQKNVSNIKNQAQAISAIKSNQSLLKSIGAEAKNVTSATEEKVIVNAVKNNLSTTMTILNKVTDTSQIDSITESVIKDAAAINKSLSLEQSAEVNKEIIQLAERAIEQSSVKVIGINHASAINASTISDLAKNGNALKDKYSKLLSDSNAELGKNIEQKVTLKLASSLETDSVNIEPTAINVLKTNNIDALVVKGNTASIEIPVETLNAIGTNSNVSFKVATVKNEGLNDVQKSVAGNSKVYEFNASDANGAVTKFNKALTISIPFDAKNVNTNNLVVYYLDDSGNTEAMAGVYDEATGMMTFKTNHFSKYFIKENTKNFVDLTGFEWATDEINALASKEIIKGATDTTFAPYKNITRAEVAQLLVRMLKLEGANTGKSFSDVPETAWYSEAVQIAYDHGYITGQSDSVFNPTANITKQELAVVIERILVSNGFNKATTDYTVIYPDAASIASWAKSSVSTITRENILESIPTEDFGATNEATRGETAVMLYNLYHTLFE